MFVYKLSGCRFETRCCHLNFGYCAYRSSHWRCSVEKCVLRNFAKFARKHLCQRLFFNKVAGLRPATLFKESLVQVFSCEFYEFSKNTFFTQHLRTTSSMPKEFLDIGATVACRFTLKWVHDIITYRVIWPLLNIPNYIFFW